MEKITEVREVAISYFQNLLGMKDNQVHSTVTCLSDCLQKTISSTSSEMFSAEIYKEETKNALFSQRGNKSPGYTRLNFLKMHGLSLVILLLKLYNISSILAAWTGK